MSNYDDWFDDPEPPTVEGGRGNRPSYETPAETEEDVWVLPEDGPRRGRRPGSRGDIVIGGRSLTSTQVAILAIAALAVLIAILAAAGVFDSHPKASLQSNSQTTQQTHTQPTTPTTPTLTPPTQQLAENDKGPQVVLLQKELKFLSFLTGKADGQFGPGTKAAVIQFQSANGLAQDGNVGPATLKKLKQALHG